MKKILLALLIFSSLAMGVTQDKIWRVPHGGSVGAWGPLNLSSGGTNAMSGQLPFAQGGIGIASCASGAIMYSDGTTAVCDTAKLQVDTGTGALTLGAYGTGLLHSNASGVITSGLVLSADLDNNIDLPGTSPSVNGGFIIASGNANNGGRLIITRGSVTAAAGVQAGEGWSASRPSTGNYTITFTTNLSSAPVVVVSAALGAVTVICTNSNTPSTSGFTVSCTNSGGGATNSGFAFIAIGK